MSIKYKVLGISCVMLVCLPSCLVQEVQQRQPSDATSQGDMGAVVPDDMSPVEDMTLGCEEDEVVFMLEDGTQACFEECHNNNVLCKNDSECYIHDNVSPAAIVCECQPGTEGMFCERCAEGYEFVPNVNVNESRCIAEDKLTTCTAVENSKCALEDTDCICLLYTSPSPRDS